MRYFQTVEFATLLRSKSIDLHLYIFDLKICKKFLKFFLNNSTNFKQSGQAQVLRYFQTVEVATLLRTVSIDLHLYMPVDTVKLICKNFCWILRDSFHLVPYRIWKIKNNIFGIFYCFIIESTKMQCSKSNIMRFARRRCIDRTSMTKLVYKISFRQFQS